MAAVKNNGVNPNTVNSWKKTSKSQIVIKSRIKGNRPNVKILKGRVILFIIGLIKKLIIPKIPPTKSNACISWAISILKKVSPGITSKLAPGTNLAARKIDKTPATMCQNSRSINDILIENYTL